MKQKLQIAVYIITAFTACFALLTVSSSSRARAEIVSKTTCLVQTIEAVQDLNSQTKELQDKHNKKLANIDTSVAAVISAIISDGWQPAEKYDICKYENKLSEYSGIINEKYYETLMFYDDEAVEDRGRLYIPVCGVDVPLSSGAGYTNGQDVVDEYNLALMRYYYGDLTIVDHATQGFDYMKLADVGTVGFIKMRTGLYKIVCIGKETGKNIGYAITTNGGKELRFHNPNGVTMYTCNDETGVSITITYWKFEEFSTEDFANGTTNITAYPIDDSEILTNGD